jgi:iron complex transport system substrate-binding protein
VYKAFGLTNIADAAPDAASGYPQLSAEYIVTSNPTLVFLADTKCCQVDAAAFAARDGFGSLNAVAGNLVFPLDDDIASRWGPRTADLYTAVAAAVASAGK